MRRERDRLIAEALSAPPPPPSACSLRELDVGGTIIQLRVPASNRMQHRHIRAAHGSVSYIHAPNTPEYHAALSLEFSRLQDAQPWYWDTLWPGGIALARAVHQRPELVRGKTVLEFGAGIGLLSLSSARAGAARVVSTDIEREALAFTAQSAIDNGVADVVTTAVWDWDMPPPEGSVASSIPFDVVLLPDVLYNDSAVERLGSLAPTLVRPGGRLILADGTDRPYAETHCAQLTAAVLRTGSFAVASDDNVRAGASAEDGGAAPDRPVRIVVLERAAALDRSATLEQGAVATAGAAEGCAPLILLANGPAGDTEFIWARPGASSPRLPWKERARRATGIYKQPLIE